MKLVIAVATSILLLCISPGASHASDAKAVLSWDEDQLIENLNAVPDGVAYLYVKLDGLPEIESMAFEAVWNPWNCWTGCYELVSSEAMDDCGWHEGAGAEELSDDIQTIWNVRFAERPSGSACVRLAFAFGTCTPEMRGTFCLRNFVATDVSGNRTRVETPNVATILGGVDSRAPHYLASVEPKKLIVGHRGALRIAGGHFSDGLELWLYNEQTSQRIDLRTEWYSQSEIWCELQEIPRDTGTWSLVTTNQDSFQARLTDCLAVVPESEATADSTAALNGRRFRRLAGVWHEVLTDGTAPIRQDVVMVKFRQEVSEAEIEDLNRSLGVRQARTNPLGWGIMYLAPGEDPIEIVSSYKRDTRIEYAETVPTGSYASNDPKYPEQYWVDRVGYGGISAADTWVFETGVDSVIIAIIDTGVDFAHEDLSGNMWTNPADPWDHDDNDHNGMVDDTHGWDFESHDGYCLRGKHGTAVAGIAAAVTNNGVGIAGVAGGFAGRCGRDGVDSGISIMALGIGVEKPDSLLEEVQAELLPDAVYYAADHGARVINMSFTLRTETNRQAIDDALDYAHDVRGCLLVASTGNEYYPYTLYPSTRDDVIAVGACPDIGNKVWAYSNRIPDVLAPVGAKPSSCIWPPVGGCDYHHPLNMWVTNSYHKATPSHVYPPPEDYTVGYAPYGRYYESFGGTSAAAPQVSAVAGLLWSCEPLLTNDEVRHKIEVSADYQEGMGWYLQGNGRLDALHALELTARPLNKGFEAGSEAWNQESFETVGEGVEGGFGDPDTWIQCDFPFCHVPIDPLQGCKSYYCDLTSPAMPVVQGGKIASITYVSDPLSVSHDWQYTVSFKSQIYASSSLGYDAGAWFRVGVVFLDENQVEISRDTTMVAEHLGSDYGQGGGQHFNDHETDPFCIPGSAQYVRIYVHVNAFTSAVNPNRYAQAGAMLDVFSLRRSEQTVDVEPRGWPGQDGRPLRVTCAPNPFRSAVDISFEMLDTVPVEVWICDVNGRLLQRYGPKPFEPGWHHVQWDGRDYRGKHMPSGVYAYRVLAGGAVATGKLVLTR